MKNLHYIIIKHHYNLIQEITKYQLREDSHNENVLQLTEQHLVPKLQSSLTY